MPPPYPSSPRRAAPTAREPTALPPKVEQPGAVPRGPSQGWASPTVLRSGKPGSLPPGSALPGTRGAWLSGHRPTRGVPGSGAYLGADLVAALPGLDVHDLTHGAGVRRCRPAAPTAFTACSARSCTRRCSGRAPRRSLNRALRPAPVGDVMGDGAQPMSARGRGRAAALCAVRGVVWRGCGRRSRLGAPPSLFGADRGTKAPSAAMGRPSRAGPGRPRANRGNFLRPPSHPSPSRGRRRRSPFVPREAQSSLPQQRALPSGGGRGNPTAAPASPPVSAFTRCRRETPSPMEAPRTHRHRPWLAPVCPHKPPPAVRSPRPDPVYSTLGTRRVGFPPGRAVR